MSFKVFRIEGSLEAENIDAALYVLALYFMRLLVDTQTVDVGHLLGDDAGYVTEMDVVPL